MEIIERRIKERNSIINKSSGYAKTLNFRCTVLLIGSYARGDFNLWSDIDLLIIGNFDSNPVKRLKNIDFPAGYETILLTPDEVKKMADKNNKFIKEAFSPGIVLRDDFRIGNVRFNSR